MSVFRQAAIGFLVVSVVLCIALVQGGLLSGEVLSAYGRAFGQMAEGFSPDFSAFLRVSWIIQLHTIAAIAALVLGAVQLFAPKGTLPHRTLGYIWAGLMFTVAATAIFITEINDGSFSFIHIFVPLTFFGLYGVITHARALRTDRHRSAVFGLFFGALLIPALFSFMPGRLMWYMLFGG